MSRLFDEALAHSPSGPFQWNPRRSIQTDPIVNMLSVELCQKSRGLVSRLDFLRCLRSHSTLAAHQRSQGRTGKSDPHDELLLRDLGYIDRNGVVATSGATATGHVERWLCAWLDSAPIHRVLLTGNAKKNTISSSAPRRSTLDEVYLALEGHFDPGELPDTPSARRLTPSSRDMLHSDVLQCPLRLRAT
jgi:hypothetical protein